MWQKAEDGDQSRYSTEPKITLDTSASTNRTLDICHMCRHLTLAISLSEKCLGLLEMPLDALFGLQLLFLGIARGTQFGQLHLSHHVYKVPEHYLSWLICHISPRTLLFLWCVVSSLFPSEIMKEFSMIFSPVFNSHLWTQCHYQLSLFSCLCFFIVPSYFCSRGHSCFCIFLFISHFLPIQNEMANETSPFCAVLQLITFRLP